MDIEYARLARDLPLPKGIATAPRANVIENAAPSYKSPNAIPTDEVRPITHFHIQTTIINHIHCFSSVPEVHRIQLAIRQPLQVRLVRLVNKKMRMMKKVAYVN